MRPILITHIAGMSFYNCKNIKYGPVQLEWEPTNVHDKNAIKVIQSGIHIGYIPKDRNKEIHPTCIATLIPHAYDNWTLMIEKPDFIVPKLLGFLKIE